MLKHLQSYIDTHPTGDIFIVLHQKGNHGPAYYKRFPESHKRFIPICDTNLLEKCSDEQINNTYDNATLYTDYFLSQVIQFLKGQQNRFESAMLYVSDHGESLGENGVYLHGLPNLIAPETQKRVAAIMWFADNFDDVDTGTVSLRSNEKFTHDNVFHTILGFLEIESDVYREDLDILKSTR